MSGLDGDRHPGQRGPRRATRRAARRSTRAPAGSTWPRSRRRSAGTTGWSWTPGWLGAPAPCWCPTTCFNCESACGLLAYVDRDTLQVRKFEGNPEHPGSRGRNCAKGPATLNQVTDPDRILRPAQARRRPRRGPVGAGELGRGPRRHRRPDPYGHRRRTGRTRSCTTSAGPARTASPSGCWPAGAWTGTTRTPTCAPAARAPATTSGWASTGPAPTTPTPR